MAEKVSGSYFVTASQLANNASPPRATDRSTTLHLFRIGCRSPGLIECVFPRLLFQQIKNCPQCCSLLTVFHT